MNGGTTGGGPINGARRDGAVFSGAPIDGAPIGGAPNGGAPVSEASIDGAPIGGAPNGGAPVSGTSIGRAPIGGASVSGASIGGASIGGASIGGAPVGGATVNGVSANGAAGPIGAAPPATTGGDAVGDARRGGGADARRDGGEIVLDSVDRAIADIRAGKPVVVVDDENRENEGDIIFAASMATPELLAFTIRHTSGVICVPMLGEDLDRLGLPLMVHQNRERLRTAYTISVDARDGVTTGISAADRARTIRALADPATEPDELVRPGHVFPLRYREGGVLVRPGHTEAAVDLARLAGLAPAGVLAEVVNDDGTMARLPELRRFADEHDLALISIEQLIDHRRRSERIVTRAAETRLPNRHGVWRAYGYVSALDGGEHVALVYGDDVADAGAENVLVRVHSECLTGDVLGSLRCDCGVQLDHAMRLIAAEGRGVVVYLRGHEGRGIGLVAKLRAYSLQDHGSDTVDANVELGLPVDAREFSNAGQILADLGIRSVRLLTNNPAKVRGMDGYGVKVLGREAMPVAANPHNLRYLAAKRDRLGHDIPGALPAGGQAGGHDATPGAPVAPEMMVPAQAGTEPAQTRATVTHPTKVEDER
jgi:3,4-dihydroxy 2-butanone 4-phosphate synthase/GTP cyclohydrolase II